MKIVSACLCGINCRYDGKSKSCEQIMDLVKKGQAIPVCPEQLGGLPTPRMPSEKQGDKIITQEGKDITKKFEQGAQEALKIAKLSGCKEAILKSKSPSCGCGEIYDGTFTGNTIKGDGIFTKLLKENGINCITEKELE